MADGVVDMSPICPICGRRFKNFAGRQNHCRQVHAKEFHATLDRATTGIKARWDREEFLLMAKYELEHQGLGTLELCAGIHEHVLKHRSAEAIKGPRNKSAAYRDILEELRRTRAEGMQPTVRLRPLRRIPAPEPPASPPDSSGSESDDHDSASSTQGSCEMYGREESDSKSSSGSHPPTPIHRRGGVHEDAPRV